MTNRHQNMSLPCVIGGPDNLVLKTEMTHRRAEGPEWAQTGPGTPPTHCRAPSLSWRLWRRLISSAPRGCQKWSSMHGPHLQYLLQIEMGGGKKMSRWEKNALTVNPIRCWGYFPGTLLMGENLIETLDDNKNIYAVFIFILLVFFCFVYGVFVECLIY